MRAVTARDSRRSSAFNLAASDVIPLSPAPWVGKAVAAAEEEEASSAFAAAIASFVASSEEEEEEGAAVSAADGFRWEGGGALYLCLPVGTAITCTHTGMKGEKTGGRNRTLGKTNLLFKTGEVAVHVLCSSFCSQLHKMRA